jgi:hypothetical protein
MATSYTHTFTWDAPLETVHAMWTDPVFQERRAQAGSPVRAESHVSKENGHAEISLFRLMRIDPPGFLKNFVGDSIGIQETQVWDGPAAGTLLVEIQKQPGDVRGTIRATESGATTTITVDVEVSVRVPLLGGKVEKYVAGILDQLLNHDDRLGRAWLAEQGPAPAAE